MSFDVPFKTSNTFAEVNAKFNQIKEKKNQKKTFDQVFVELGFEISKFDEKVLEIYYKYCDDESELKRFSALYLENFKVEVKKSDDKVINELYLVIQHLTQTSFKEFEKEKETLNEAVKKVALKRTKNLINSGQNMSCHELVPILSRSDSFGQWIEDHLNNQIIIWLKIKEGIFPSQWKTNEQTQFDIIREKCYEKDFKSVINIDNSQNIINMSLNEFFETRLKFNFEEIKILEAEFKRQLIMSVDEMLKLSDKAWDKLNDLFPTKIEKIRAEISKQSPNSSMDDSDKKTKLTRGEELAEWHKTKRFLLYESGMKSKLEEIGLLSYEALLIGLEEQKMSTSFNGGPMLYKIKQFFREFTVKNDSQSHGMLMYGPPGTGKTTLINVIIKKSGLKKITEPFASTELNRGIVGETEQVIRDVIRRGHTYPYLLCCCAIDEIDAVVPKRDGSGNQKIEALTQFLTIIGGINDVKNVYMIGATNRFNKIDDAFLRRLGHKFYVGNLSARERYDLLLSIGNRIKNIDFIIQNEDNLKVMTTNFSGAASNFLKSQIIQTFNLDPKRTTINEDELNRIINEVATSYKVKFGGMTIADLLRNSSSEIDLKSKWDDHLEKIINPTGRVLIDLQPEVLSMQFELSDETVYEISLKEELKKNIKFLSDLVPFLLFFCIKKSIDYVKFIDSDYIILQGAEEKSSTMNLILDCFTDFENYNKGLLLFDGDTIIGVDSSGTEEASLSEELGRSIVDKEVWKNCILHIFKKLADPNDSLNKKPEEKNMNEESNDEEVKKVKVEEVEESSRWCIFVTSSKFLVDSFKSSLKFPETREEEEERKLDTKNKEEPIKCINCDKYYYEKDNGLDSCSYHPDYLVNTKGDYSPNKRLTMEELEQVVRMEKNPEVFKNYVWFCCMKECSNDNGCRKYRHMEKVEDSLKHRKPFIKSNFHSEFSKYYYTIKYVDTFANNSHKYLTVDQTSKLTDKTCKKSDPITISEMFELKKNVVLESADGERSIKYSIKSKMNDKYLNIDNLAYYSNSSFEESEKFQIECDERNFFSIKNTKGVYLPQIRTTNSQPIYFELEQIEPLSSNIESSNKSLIKNLISLESVSNNKLVTIQDNGYSPLCLEETELNERSLFIFEQIDGKYFSIRSALNQKYVTIDPDENELTVNEDDASSVLSYFEIKSTFYDKNLICLKSHFGKYVTVDKCLNQLIADSKHFDQSGLFRITSHNQIALNKEIQNHDHFPGFYTIFSTKCQKYLKIDLDDKINHLIIDTNDLVDDNNEMQSFSINNNNDNKLGIFKIIKIKDEKTNDEFYQFISKANDLCLCLNSDQNLVFDSYKRDKEESKFRLGNSIQSTRIQSITSENFINTNEDINSIFTSKEADLFNIFPVKDFLIESNTHLLANNYFSIETYIGNKTLRLDSNGLFRPSDDLNNNLFFFESKNPNQFFIFLNDKIAIDVNDDLMLSHNMENNRNEPFNVELVSFEQNLVCFKTTNFDPINKYIRLDLKQNVFVADTDPEHVNEFNMFRIRNQNIKVFQ